MTCRIEPFFLKYYSQNWTFFQNDSQNWTFFFNTTHRNGLISWIWRKDLSTLFFWIWRNELNRLIFENDSQNWTFFQFRLTELIPFYYVFKNWTHFPNRTPRTEPFNNTTQRFCSLKMTLKNWFCWTWLKELNLFRKCNSKTLFCFLKITKLLFEYRLKE